MPIKGLFSAIVLLGVSTMSVNANAQVYVETGIGVSQKSFSDCRGDTKCNLTSGNALKLTGGYILNKDFSLEASVFTLGNDTYTLTSPYQQYTAKTKTNGVSLAGVFNYELSEGFSGFAKLGIASLRSSGHWTESTSLDSASYKNSSTNLFLGAGLKYKANDKVSFTLGIDQFRIKSNLNRPASRTISLGAQYQF